MRIAGILLCLGLAACSGAHSQPPPPPLACVSLPPEGRYVRVEAQGCAGCSLFDARQAVDGDLATFATARIPATARGPLKLRAGNLGGAAEPQASPGAILQVTQGSIDYDKELELLLTLRGVAQGAGAPAPGVTRQGPLARLSFGAPAAFDELELRLFQRGGEDMVVQIHELCRA